MILHLVFSSCEEVATTCHLPTKLPRFERKGWIATMQFALVFPQSFYQTHSLPINQLLFYALKIYCSDYPGMLVATHHLEEAEVWVNFL